MVVAVHVNAPLIDLTYKTHEHILDSVSRRRVKKKVLSYVQYPLVGTWAQIVQFL